MERAIVFGATGVLGSALVKLLVQSGIETLVFVRESSTRKANILQHPLVKIKYCSLEDISCVNNDTGKKFDVFYHLAWNGNSGAIRHDIRQDMYLQNLNVKYALDAVETAKRFGCKRFVFAGSQAEYGLSEMKLRSDTPTFPVTGYGYAKLCAGYMTRERAHQLGIEHIWTRVLSVYGPNSDKSTIVALTIEQLYRGIVPKLTKCEQLWDFLYCDDAARAFIFLGDRGIDRKIYVIGSGECRPLSEYVEIIKKTVAPLGKIHYGAIPYRKQQIMHLSADISEIRKDTGWSPEISFGDGIKLTLLYMCSSQNE